MSLSSPICGFGFHNFCSAAASGQLFGPEVTDGPVASSEHVEGRNLRSIRQDAERAGRWIIATSRPECADVEVEISIPASQAWVSSDRNASAKGLSPIGRGPADLPASHGTLRLSAGIDVNLLGLLVEHRAAAQPKWLLAETVDRSVLIHPKTPRRTAFSWHLRQHLWPGSP